MDHVNTLLWHPSLKLKVLQHCAAFPGNLLFDGNRPIQTVSLNDHLYIGAGAMGGSERDKCRLFEYSVTLNTWDIIDTHLAEFALASYHSKLILVGGRECEFDYHGLCTQKPPTNKVWFLDDQYQFQEAEIPPMNKSRKCALAVGHENHLIVVGGDDGKPRTVEIYDDETKKWLFAPSLPESQQLLQSIVMHPDGNLYIQLSKVLWATLKSLNDSCTPNVQESNNSTSFWKELPNSLDRVHSNLMLCQDSLLILGVSHQIQYDKKYMFIYRSSDPTQQWIKIADVPLDLYEHTANMSRIISLPDDQLLLVGPSGSWKEAMFLISFHVSAVKLDSLFTLWDLEMLKLGTNLSVYSKLEPFAYDLKDKVGLGNLSDEQTSSFKKWHGDTDLIHTFIIRWIESKDPNIEHTWVNLIQLLEEFGEKMFADELKHYLTFPPGCTTSKKTSMEELTIKKLETIKLDIEQLSCCHDLPKDANIEIHQQLQECVKLCDAAKKRLTEEYRELDTKHEELLKENEELNSKLELLKQTKLHS